MKNELVCTECEEAIPAYLNGTLAAPLRAQIERHLLSCLDCQSACQFWQAVACTTQENAERILPERSLSEAWERLHAHITQEETQALSSFQSLVRSASLFTNIIVAHLWAQVRLIKSDLWWISLLGLPLITGLLFLPASWQNRADASAFVASLVTALGMAFLYGQEVDPAYEMVLVTPTPNRLILLSRIGIVFTFDLLVNTLEVLPFFFHSGALSFSWIMVNWLAPLCCLTALSVLLSILARPVLAIITCTLLWVLRLLSNPILFPVTALQQAYEHFWHQGMLLFLMALTMVIMVFFVLERKEASSL
jgi:hypothetical protein